MIEYDKEKPISTTNVPQIPSSMQPDEVLALFNTELKHPINSIKGCAVLLKKYVPERQQDVIAQVLGMAEWVEGLRAAVSDYLQKNFE